MTKKFIKYNNQYSKQVADFINESMYMFINRPYKDREDVLDINNYYIKNNGIFYIALDNNKIIGTIALENKGNIGILKRFYVDKNYQKLGIGNRLYEMIETYIKEKTKIKKVILTCNEILTDAHKFYLKRGYKQVAHLELELEHLDNDYFFIKSILR